MSIYSTVNEYIVYEYVVSGSVVFEVIVYCYSLCGN